MSHTGRIVVEGSSDIRLPAEIDAKSILQPIENHEFCGNKKGAPHNSWSMDFA
jgi:hypothetical protein